MDELVHHCLRELSFDGDLGCDVSRLRDFIQGYYAHNTSGQQQNVDDAYCAFVWSVIVQQPGVRVGTVPPGAAAEVYVAPQASAKRKAQSKGEEAPDEPTPVATLDEVPDAALRPLEDLRRQYGDGLRIATDHEISFAAITGSHIRPSKLTPMVYTALQLITRGRDNGVSVVDLGKKTGYDQKTCFYLIKQLLDLDLIVKRRQPGSSTNIAVHKYFFERSPVWKQVLEEEAEANRKDQRNVKAEPDDSDEEGGSDVGSPTTIHFDPIDSRHLSSLPLIKARVVKLLKNSPNNLHASQNMLIKIGFQNPVKADRRFFRSRLRELMDQGLIDKVQVPHADRERFPDRKITCIRLLRPGDNVAALTDVSTVAEAELEAELVQDDNKVKMNLTIHRQIIDLLQASGTRGMTLNELTAALNDFDRRTVELILSRLEKDPPPSHLSDLGIAQLGETHGRERRYKYFTVVNYRVIALRENFEDSRYLDVDLSNVGGFLPVNESVFYNDGDSLVQYVDNYKSKQEGKASGKSKARKNPLLADGSVKKGRPRKGTDGGETTSKAKGKRGQKRKRVNDEEFEGDAGPSGPLEESPPKRKRGRPPKVRPPPEDENASAQAGAGKPSAAGDGDTVQEQPIPKKRGRPPKKRPAPPPEAEANPGEDAEIPPPPPRKRGRPRKSAVPAPEAETEGGDDFEEAPLPSPPPVPRKRGRLRKSAAPPAEPSAELELGMEDDDIQEVPPLSPPSLARTRGRPRKSTVAPAAADAEEEDNLEEMPPPAVPPKHRKQGRPRKSAAPDPAASMDVDELVQDSAPEPPSVESEDAAIESSTVVAADFAAVIEIVARETAVEVQDEIVTDVAVGEQITDATVEPSTSADNENGTPLRRSSRRPKPRLPENNASPYKPRSPQKSQSLDAATSTPRVRKRLTTAVSDSRDEASVASDPSVSDQRDMDKAPTSHAVFVETADAVHETAPAPLSAATPVPHTTIITEDVIDPALRGQEPECISPSIPNGSAAARAREEQASHDVQDIARKRDHPGSTATEPPAKRAKTQELQKKPTTGYRAKSNISQSRREKELLQIIGDVGGIMNVSVKEFFEAHGALVTAIVESGGAASQRPDTRLDKRTADWTLRDMESRGKIKLLTTSVATTTGGSRQVRIAYLPDVSDNRLNEFLSNLSYQNFPPTNLKVIEDVAYGDITPTAAKRPAPTDDLDPVQIRQLFQSDDKTVRDALLTEKNTLAQLYGYIPGKAARARELHLLTVKAFESGSPSPRIVSKSERIIQMSYYYDDLPLAPYCALVSCIDHDELVLQQLQSEEGRKSPVGKLPLSMQAAFQIGRWRSRAKILELLDMLAILGLVDPLMPSQTEHPTVVCDANGEHPTSFDIVPVTVWSPPTAPHYWRFKTAAPLFSWAVSDSPPLWKSVPVSTIAECYEFWHATQDLSLNTSNAPMIAFTDADTKTDPIRASTAKTLRRLRSWNNIYILSSLQSEYLTQFIDHATGNTPLQDVEHDQARLDRICWIVSAPKDAVCHFFERTRNKRMRELERIRERTKRRQEVEDTEAKALLAKKAAEAKAQRERTWEELVNRVYPEPLKGPIATRLRRIRTQFLQAPGMDLEKWEEEIKQALQDAKMTAKKVTSTGRPPLIPTFAPTTPLPLPPVVSAASEKPIEDLIAQQGPPLALKEPKKKGRKGKERAEEELEASKDRKRRHRFKWNRDYDELARDAAAIIKARCRDTRVDWGALEQVFPAIPRNSVRQRIVAIREIPGSDAYQARLEDQWYDLWLQHRGTPALPDDHPTSPINFDLLAHIKFLRKHIDKNALRVGFLQTASSVKISLPTTVEELEQLFEVDEKPQTAPQWDLMWNFAAEEGREKQLAQTAFVADISEMPDVDAYAEDRLHLADSAMKMTLGTPNDIYDSQIASDMLSVIGEEPIKTVTSNLLSRGILSKVIRDPKKMKPGRALKISEINQNALSGSVPTDLFQDASAMEEDIATQDNAWREWPLLATDGDIAALIEQVSQGNAEFAIDTARAQAARSSIDWNSKKADDDDIETSVRVRFRPVNRPEPLTHTSDAETTPVESSTDVPDAEVDDDHGYDVHGNPASCRLSGYSLVDCTECIRQAASKLVSACEEDEARVTQRLLHVLEEVGPEGLTKAQIWGLTDGTEMNTVRLAVSRLTDSLPAPAIWTGYTSVVLVSSYYLKDWTVSVPETEDSKILIFPRRWLDIFGRKIIDVWEAALKAVTGIILLHPGVSQSEIRWRLRSVYDRQEVNEVLQHLYTEGYLDKQSRSDTARALAGPPDDAEEKMTFWFLGNRRRWYQV
ncbi:hypothetical protein OBBRIDRAFT_787280 [Obba rivulosa]|uniref:Homeobox domain-containing protein n=1 Tax=Obba rivulosa TaxID=1052685 RepID=A0A8E2J7N6_9APHY|nr:hypothetical protein OBBRIDRAFT_787280 [Obba rivulosa]